MTSPHYRCRSREPRVAGLGLERVAMPQRRSVDGAASGVLFAAPSGAATSAPFVSLPLVYVFSFSTLGWLQPGLPATGAEKTAVLD